VTIAGNGKFRFTPDKTPATQPFLFGALGVAVDGPGNIYIGDSRAAVIWKVTVDGLIQDIYGKPGVTAVAGGCGD
jgi:hypothetical protein